MQWLFFLIFLYGIFCVGVPLPKKPTARPWEREKNRELPIWETAPRDPKPQALHEIEIQDEESEYDLDYSAMFRRASPESEFHLGKQLESLRTPDPLDSSLIFQENAAQ